jgi:hypothetical protein
MFDFMYDSETLRSAPTARARHYDELVMRTPALPAPTKDTPCRMSAGSLGVMAALAAGCSLMSAYHDFVFWRWSGRGVIISAILTLCFVGYNALSLYLWRANRRWYIAALGIVVMAFTMSATAISSYLLQQAGTDVTVDTSIYDTRAAILTDAATEAQAAIDAAVAQETEWRNTSWARADAARKAEADARQRLATIRAEQDALQADKAAAQAQATTDKTEGIWEALASFLGADAALIRFLVLVIPALFLDIFPPIMVECVKRGKV